MAINKQERNSLRGKLLTNNYVKISYALIHRFDAETSLFITCLIEMEVYNESKNLIDEDGFFLAKREYILKRINISKRKQMRITDNLVKCNFITYKKKSGTPPMGYIRINHSLLNLALDNFNFIDYQQ